MHSNFFRRLACAALWIGATATLLPAATVTFSGATSWGATSDGTSINGVTSTSGCCQLIFVEAGTFTGDSNNAVTLPYTMTDGYYTFFLSSPDWSYFFGGSAVNGGLNLFFDGDTTPDISVYGAPTSDQTVFNPFFLNSSSYTLDLSDSGVAGSGSGTYSGGALPVTITGMQWVFGGTQSSYNNLLTVIRVDLTVGTPDTSSGAPEPATFAMIGGALALLGIRKFRRQQL